MQIEFTVSGLKPRQRRRPPAPSGPLPVAPAVRTIVLAYQIEEAVREGRTRGYAGVAKQTGLTRARVSQIMRLLNRPAALIERLLLADPKQWPHLTERKLRPLVASSSSIEKIEELEGLLRVGDQARGD